MPHPYKTYTLKQLQAEEEILAGKLKQAKLEQRTNHVLVYNRKIELVQSFMLNPDDFQAGDLYELKDDPDHLFEVTEISGVTAWGYKIHKETKEKAEEQRGKLLAQLHQVSK